MRKKLMGTVAWLVIAAMAVSPVMASEYTADIPEGDAADTTVFMSEVPDEDAGEDTEFPENVPDEDNITVADGDVDNVDTGISDGVDVGIPDGDSEEITEETSDGDNVVGGGTAEIPEGERTSETDQEREEEQSPEDADPADDAELVIDEYSTEALNAGESEDEVVAVTGVSLNKTKLTIKTKDQTPQLTATVKPSDASDASVTWTSSDTSVVTVDKNGKLTAVKDGTAKITVTTTDGKYTADCAVTVSLYSDGFHQDPDGSDWCYYKNGKIATGTTDIIQGTVDGTSGYWNVVKGKVVTSATVAKGTVNGTNAWWYVNKKGRVDTSYTGFATNSNGSWYAENGKVTKKTNGVIKDEKGALGSKSDWYYVLNSKVQYSFTGLADYKNASGWWYITNGKVDRSVTTIAKNKNGWYYVKNGKVDKSYTGFGTNSNGSWYVEKGKVTKKVNGVYKDTTGALGSKSDWYYVLNNKVQYNFTGLADYSNASGWWYITKGKVDRSYNGLAKNKNGWYYLTNGKVDRSFTGTAKNSNGWWYVEKGKVDKSAVALVKVDGVWQAFRKGKLDSSYTGMAVNGNGWYYVDNGTYVAEEALKLAARFVMQNSSSSQSASSRLKACYDVLWGQYPYIRTYGDSHEASAMSGYAVDMFKNKGGNCLRYAASFACVAKVLGYDVRVAVGEISSARGGMTNHAWTEIYVEGQWLICDPDMQMNYPNINVYMVTESSFPYRHTCSARYRLTISDGEVIWK